MPMLQEGTQLWMQGLQPDVMTRGRAPFPSSSHSRLRSARMSQCEGSPSNPRAPPCPLLEASWLSERIATRALTGGEGCGPRLRLLPAAGCPHQQQDAHQGSTVLCCQRQLVRSALRQSCSLLETPGGPEPPVARSLKPSRYSEARTAKAECPWRLVVLSRTPS
jgi:hypothetical protein